MSQLESVKPGLTTAGVCEARPDQHATNNYVCVKKGVANENGCVYNYVNETDDYLLQVCLRRERICCWVSL